MGHRLAATGTGCAGWVGLLATLAFAACYLAVVLLACGAGVVGCSAGSPPAAGVTVLGALARADGS